MRFEAKPTGDYKLRHGSFRDGARILRTPEFIPVINIMTGPPSEPEPLLANGGIWKWIKRLALVPSRGRGKDLQVHAYLSQVLHFADFRLSKDTLDAWIGEPHSIRRHLLHAREATETPAEAKRNQPWCFVDSGGYKLLSSEQIDLSAYGKRTRPRDILDFQVAYDGDFVATLDYPVPPNAPDRVARDRFQKSKRNALAALRMLRASDDDRMVYLAVHGRNGQETYTYARSLLRAIPRDAENYGLALGSLVPLNNNPAMLLDNVAGASRALYEHAPHPHNVPLHAFGVNSSVAPFLGLFGVDTYDGTSFVRAAQNVRYFAPGGYSPVNLRSLTELTCECAACDIMRAGVWKHEGKTLRGLAAIQRIVSLPNPRPNYYLWKDGVVDDVTIPESRLKKGQRKDTRGVPRSYFYALIAMHNLQSSLGHARKLREGDYLGVADDIIATNPSKGKMRQIFSALAKHFPGLVDEVREHGRATLASGETRHVIPLEIARKPKSHLPSLIRTVVATDPSLGPDAFNVNANGYEFPKYKRVLLLVPCSKTKPYGESLLHRTLIAALAENEIDLSQIEKVTLSGNYGPVPETYEKRHPTLAYDFRLHASNLARIKLVQARLSEFLDTRVPQNVPIIAYATQRPYRKIMMEALKDRPRSKVLPDPLARHTPREFLDKKNLEKLAHELSPLLEARRVASRSQ